MIAKIFFLVIVIFSICLITSGYVINTKNGLIRGSEKKLSNGSKIYAYLGVPYAKPPLGSLRFQPPQPSTKWNNIRDTITQKPQCVQLRSTYVRTDKIEGSEDCLYLNVYTPKLSSKNISYPVMIWIHGGGFLEGDNSYELYPPDNFLEQDIIVVTITYRMGIFGFLNTGDLVSPGNNGLRDQIMALKWVNENIENFGGDKDRITLWGESTGGISISHLVASPLAKGLFQKVIIESGTSITDAAVGINQHITAFKTGSLLKINTTDSQELVTELRKVDFRELQAAASRAGVAIKPDQPLITYTTVVEPKHANAVIPTSPFEILEKGEDSKVQVLMGVNANEGDGLPDILIRMAIEAANLAPAALVPVGLNLNMPDDINIINTVGTLIKEHYFPGDTTDFTEANFVNWYGDMHMVRPVIQQGIFLSKVTDVYFYEFSYVGDLGTNGNPLKTNRTIAGHAEELNYLFPRLTQPRILSSGDKLCSERLVKLWGNFVKYGNPTPVNDPLLQGIIWPKTAPVPNMKYLHIDNNLSVRTNPDEQDFKFWTYIFNNYGKRPFTVF